MTEPRTSARNTLSLKTAPTLKPVRKGQSEDVIVIGAGAAGLMAAMTAAERGKSVLVLDHASKLCEKIRISGGGRCNFTNIHCAPHNFLSDNPRFVRPALKAYTQRDFLKLVESHNIAWHEKTLGQLFCDHSANDIIDMLLERCSSKGARVLGQTTITAVRSLPVQDENSPRFELETSDGLKSCRNLVVATGGLSIPKIGATNFGHRLAQNLNIPVTPLRPALVPLVLQEDDKEFCKAISGLSLPVRTSAGKQSFEEALLFTHRGLSGPSILQISSYWQPGGSIRINLLPGEDIPALMAADRQSKKNVSSILSNHLPNRLAKAMADKHSATGSMTETGKKTLNSLIEGLSNWQLTPAGDEGYNKAEVTLGGVDTRSLDPATMECRDHPGLFFIGEVTDVTGHLGGHNFQWAWSSGFAAGLGV
ncbi:NAD(P)/FAD-dependent oxidoreductase [Kiloniella sp. b19]|uniref:NAD(P)/FAD-dependent oxidoreductase n=1 Tax=Kiloniella sp. GXU_MW_B19 TaxID=3141326 RepID=UPI0031CFF755